MVHVITKSNLVIIIVQFIVWEFLSYPNYVIKNRLYRPVEKNADFIIQLSPIVSMQVLVIALLLKILMRKRFSLMQVFPFSFS